MSDQHFAHFQSLPKSLNVLYTLALLVLGTGYLFAMIYLFEVHAGRDGKPGLSVTDLVIAYSGSRGDTRLEAAIKGPMMAMLPREDAAAMIAWVRGGAGKEDFEAKVVPILKAYCLACHDGSNPHVPNLQGYANVIQMAKLDVGMDLFTLVRVSHIHLFGLTFIFFITGSIFAHAHVRPAWVKYAIIAVPFLSILLDVSSWYLTKVHTAFAWVVMISGFFMGIAFALQWAVSLYQIWFYRPPATAEQAGRLA